MQQFKVADMNPSKGFGETCNKIEKDPNFGIKVKNWDLVYIATTKLRSENQAITLEAQDEKCNLGKLYNVLQAECTSRSIGYGQDSWKVVKTQILVGYNGSVSFYKESDEARSNPLIDMSLDQFLGKPHLVGDDAKFFVQYASR